MPTLGASLFVGAPNLYDVGASAARVRKVWGVDADLSSTVTVATRPLLVDPAAGNALTWTASGMFVAAGSIPSNPVLIDPIVRDIIQWGVKPSGAVDTTLQRTTAGTLRLGSASATWYESKMTGSTSSAWFGQAVPGAAGTSARLDLTAGAYYNGSAWIKQEAAQPAAVLSMMPSTVATSLLLGVWDFDTAAGANLVEKLSLTRQGNLAIGLGGGSTPIQSLIPHPGNRIMLFAGSGILEGSGAGTYVSISDNYYFSSAAVGRTIYNGPASFLQQANGVLTFANAPAVAPGTTVAMANRFSIAANGTSSFFSDGSNYAIDCYNNINLRPGPSNLAGIWYTSADNTSRCFLGMDSGSTTSWRLYTPAIGNAIQVDLVSGRVAFAKDVGISGALSVTGIVTGNGSVFNLSSPNNIQLSPAGTYIHPSGNNTINMGHPGLAWATTFTFQVTSPGGSQLNINGGFHIINTCTNGGWIYNRSTGHNFFDGSQGAIVAPEIDNKLICGGTGNRWIYIAAVNGGINTCWAHEKEIVEEIKPAEALTVLLNSPMYLFHPKDNEGTVDEEMTFAGPVNTSVDPKLQIGKGALTAAGHQAAYAIASIQELASQIVELREEIARIREAQAS